MIQLKNGRMEVLDGIEESQTLCDLFKLTLGEVGRRVEEHINNNDLVIGDDVIKDVLTLSLRRTGGLLDPEAIAIYGIIAGITIKEQSLTD